MSIVKVSSIIAALQGIPGAIVASQNSKSNKLGQFEIENLWLPDQNPSDDGSAFKQEAVDLASSIFIDLDDERLSKAINASRNTPSPWGNPSEEGTDALAWYVSFHRDPMNWGIYLPISGLFKFAGHIVPNNFNPVDFQSLVRLAARGLLAHERVHYAADFASAQLELMFDAPCYIDSRKALSLGFGHVPVEEQLANGACLRAIRHAPREMKIRGAYHEALAFTLTQPVGYRDGIHAEGTNSFLHIGNELIEKFGQQFPKQKSPTANLPIDYSRLMPLGPLTDFRGRASQMASVDGAQCPVYLVHDESILGIPPGAIRFISSIPLVQESKRFKKELLRELLPEWGKTKDRLADPEVPKHIKSVDLKRWPKEDKPGVKVWSVRVGLNTGYRAHLDNYDNDDRWVADRVGDKTKMGH